MKKLEKNKMKKICVIGSEGFVGKQICTEINQNKNFELIRVSRRDNLRNAIEESDLIIHSANSSKRFYANQNRLEDLFETIEKMLKIIKLSKNKKIVLISTVSARAQIDSSYGAHRRACELLLDLKKDLVIRMSNMYGNDCNKGVLFDIINNNDVYASPDTKCAFVDVKYNASKVIDMMLDSVGIVEIGAKDYVELRQIAEIISSKSKFLGESDTQLPLGVSKCSPSATKVFDFVKEKIKEKQ